MRNILSLGLVGIGLFWSEVASAQAAMQDHGYHVLRLREAPDAGNLHYTMDWRDLERRAAMRPYAVLDGPGRAVVAAGENWSNWDMRLDEAQVAIRAPRGEAVTGTVYVPNDAFSGMRAITFSVAADALAAQPDERYYEVVERRNRELWEGDFSGAAWFRHRMHEARTARGVEARDLRTQRQQEPQMRDGLNATYELYSGARAVSENLQLDEFLRVDEAAEPPEMEPVDDIVGITVEEVAWEGLIKDLKPSEDWLAARIPADQYAVFLPDLDTSRRLIAELEQSLLPILHGMNPQAVEQNLVERYLRQLAMPLDELDSAARAAGLRALAVTGSDPYWPSGTDLAVVFEVENPAPLMQLLRRAQSEAAEAAGIEPGELAIEAMAVTAVTTEDRRLSTYLAKLDERTVVVSNSRVQMQRLHEVASGNRRAIGDLDEFTFMNARHRYRNMSGAMVLIITDGAIRKWGSARWRIAASRRIRMLATMLDSHARHLDEIVTGHVEPVRIEVEPAVPDAGTLRLTSSGVRCSVYNTPAFITPIAELDFDQVTSAEGRAYRAWRDRYQSRWEAFDPIGLTLSLEDERIETELTVLPLLRWSEYGEMVQIAGDATIGPHDGDPHEDALVHLVMAIDVKAPRVRGVGDMARMMGLGAEPFAWVGESVAAYLDDDPFWDDVLSSEDAFEAIQDRLNDLPLGLEVAVRDRMRLAAFMVVLRGFVQQTVPGLTVWENFQHAGAEYVRITTDMEQMGGDMDELAVFYAARDSLTMTVSESLLHRAIERRAKRKVAATDDVPPDGLDTSWLGKHLALRMRGRAFDLLSRFQRDSQIAAAQRAAWRNLPILNEWRHRYPDLDPMDVHEAFAQHRLACPGGGDYVWNEQWQTMESTVFGHPGKPSDGPLLAERLRSVRDANFGVTFEHGGLHGRAILHRVRPVDELGEE